MVHDAVNLIVAENRDKLLEEVDGAPLLARQARIALQAVCAALSALPSDRPGRWRRFWVCRWHM